METRSIEVGVLPIKDLDHSAPQTATINLLDCTEDYLKGGFQGGGATNQLERVLPWEATVRGPFNTKILELRGKYKDIFDSLGGGEAFLAELRREPEEPQP